MSGGRGPGTCSSNGRGTAPAKDANLRPWGASHGPHAAMGAVWVEARGSLGLNFLYFDAQNEGGNTKPNEIKFCEKNLKPQKCTLHAVSHDSIS